MKKILIVLLLTLACTAMAQTTCIPEPDLSSTLGVKSQKPVAYNNIKRVISKNNVSRFTSLYPATVSHLKGDVFLVQRNGVAVEQALSVGSSLQLGDVVQTGRQSFVTIVLSSGVSSSLPSNAKIRLQQASSTVARYELLQGSIENRVIKKPNPKHSTFEITVPNGVLGVRGTHFWVTADVGNRTSSVTVAEGVVVLRPFNSCSVSLVVTAGQSALIKPIFAPNDVQSSVAMPDLLEVTAQRGTDLLFEPMPVTGANGYMVQVARDADFTEMIAEGSGDARVVVPAADMNDGFYYVRAGAIDARGVNGFGRGVLFLRNRK